MFFFFFFCLGLKNFFIFFIMFFIFNTVLMWKIVGVSKDSVLYIYI